MKKLITLGIALFSLQTMADDRSLDRTWLGLFGKRKVTDNTFIWTEGQARLDNDRFTDQQILLRPGLLRKLDDKNELGLLYAFVETSSGTRRTREHRPTLQYVHTFLKNDSGTLSLRNRLEYRKREDLDAISGRYRGLLRYQHTLEGKRSLIFWEEPFINVTKEDWTGSRILERNRLFAGVGIPIGDTSLEVGYMNQYTPRKNRAIFEHILTVYYFY